MLAESLKNYSQQATANHQAQKIKVSDQADPAQNSPANHNRLNKLTALHNQLDRHPGLVACFRSNFSNVVDQTFHDMPIKTHQQQALQGGLVLPNNNEPPS